MSKAKDAFRTISEVAQDLAIPKHVLRFWEVKFPQIRPMKRGGGRRYYRPEDLELLYGIRALLHGDGYTIKGVQRILKEQGIDTVKATGRAAEAATLAKQSQAAAATGGARGTRARARAAATAAALSPTQRAAALRKAISELEACRSLLQDARAGRPVTLARGAGG